MEKEVKKENAPNENYGSVGLFYLMLEKRKKRHNGLKWVGQIKNRGRDMILKTALPLVLNTAREEGLKTNASFSHLQKGSLPHVMHHVNNPIPHPNDGTRSSLINHA
ncbi:unnamed protein product [Sphenostylis stenocarpa]|uniref:Uncharacterized protein n=1 Tax=Sphenostylis stenocarpa TaxID=92480 RepID=A0AA86W151_9FABA|nr:unnamed protein product [Sphenostylis stenocarpa]